MTTREFLSAVASSANLSAELVEFASAELAKMDARNSKRRSTPTKEQIANEEVKVSIVDALNNNAHFASEVAATCGITTQKASALLRQLVASGKVTVEEVKVKGKGAVKSYALA